MPTSSDDLHPLRAYDMSASRVVTAVTDMRVLVVDDLDRARQGMLALLSTCPQVAAVREAGTGRQALRCVDEWLPDVVLLDACMAEMNGLETTRRIKARWPQVVVFVVSMYAEYEAEALTAGADAFVTKGEPVVRLLALLQSVVDRRG